MVANNNVIIHVAIGPIQIYDPPTEEWTILRPIEGPGLLYSIVELADNRILMVGVMDQEDGELVPMAALFDAASDSWVAAPPPDALRAQPNLLLLQDGRVFMTAGLAVTVDDLAYFSNPEKLNSSEIFDPLAGIWVEAADTHEMIEGADLLLLKDGQVLMIGTTGERARGVPHAEVYDPAVDTWTILDSLDPHYSPTEAVLLSDGRLLVIGGLTSLR